MGLFGPPDIQKLKASRDVKGLVRALGYKDFKIREQAVIALSYLMAPAALPALVVTLETDEILRVRQAAAKVLGSSQDARALDPLVRTLKHKNPDLRACAAEALGSLKNSGAIPALVEALADVEPTRGNAAAALETLGWHPVKQDGAAAAFWVYKKDWEKCARCGAEAVPVLISASKVVDPNESLGAIRTLGLVGDARAVVSLVSALRIGTNDVNKAAAISLGRIAALPGTPPEAAGRIVTALTDLLSSRENTSTFYRMLGPVEEGLVLAGPPAVDALISMLGSQDQAVCNLAARALGQIGAGQSDPTLRGHILQALSASLQKHPPVRVAALEGLYAIGDARASTAVAGVVRNQDVKVCQAALHALEKIGDAYAIDPLLEVLQNRKYPARPQAATTLGAVAARLEPGEEQNRLVQALIDLLQHDDIRKEVVEALVKTGKSALQPMLAACHSGKASSLPSLLEALTKVAKSQSDDAISRAVFEQHLESFLAGEESAIPGLGEVGAVLKDAGLRQKAAASLAPALLKGKEMDAGAISQALDLLGWQPGADESGAVYWVLRKDWEKCVQVGASAAGPLLEALDHEEALFGEREKIGAALGTIYSHSANPEMRAQVEHGLIAALLKDNAGAVTALDTLGWRPGQDNASAHYHVLKQDFAACVPIGTPAVGPLLAVLEGHPWAQRKAAAEALVSLYRSGKLNQASAERILKMRDRIIAGHDDRYIDYDVDDRCDASLGTHERIDSGIGVDFPL